MTSRAIAISALMIAGAACGMAGTAVVRGQTPETVLAPFGRTDLQQMNAAVIVHADCAKGGGTGSGVIVSSREVITAAHVVACDDGADPQSVSVLYAGSLARMEITGTYPDHDIARLRAPASRFPPPYALEIAPVSLGQRVCVATRFPEITRRCGTVTARLTVPTLDVRYSQCTIPGNSGSGIYDERGRLVGLSLASLRHTDTGTCMGGAGTALAGREWTVRGM